MCFVHCCFQFLISIDLSTFHLGNFKSLSEFWIWRSRFWTWFWCRWVFYCSEYTTLGYSSPFAGIPEELLLVLTPSLVNNGSSPWWMLVSLSLSLSLQVQLEFAIKKCPLFAGFVVFYSVWIAVFCTVLECLTIKYIVVSLLVSS